MYACRKEAGVEQRKSLRRSRANRMIGGVVGGLAEYVGMDPVLARVLYILISVFSAAFPGILVYIILWIVIPEEQVSAS
jgi:phage shock protein C